ncbi:MAG: SHOCT domain-containing protein [Methylococcaceae bacterium]
MQEFTQYGQQLVQNLAQRYGFSTDAVTTLLNAVVSGNGSMAQFYHPELGGNGQWMQGGMIMLGDMFNNNLKASVDGMCREMSQVLMNGTALFVAPPVVSGMSGTAAWWPMEWGQPSATGSQNNTRYGIFPVMRRLALEQGGQMIVYDTLDHQISGISQQQGGGVESWTFNSQYGVVRLNTLPVVSDTSPQSTPMPLAQVMTHESDTTDQNCLEMIGKLGELLQRGLITQEEFNQKKTELLGRI